MNNVIIRETKTYRRYWRGRVQLIRVISKIARDRNGILKVMKEEQEMIAGR